MEGLKFRLYDALAFGTRIRQDRFYIAVMQSDLGLKTVLI